MQTANKILNNYSFTCDVFFKNCAAVDFRSNAELCRVVIRSVNHVTTLQAAKTIANTSLVENNQVCFAITVLTDCCVISSAFLFLDVFLSEYNMPFYYISRWENVVLHHCLLSKVQQVTTELLILAYAIPHFYKLLLLLKSLSVHFWNGNTLTNIYIF